MISNDKVSEAFEDNRPLLTSICAEALKRQPKTQILVKRRIAISALQLGEVGNRIVTENFLGPTFRGAHSLLSVEPAWEPEHAADAPKDFVNRALSRQDAIVEPR